MTLSSTVAVPAVSTVTASDGLTGYPTSAFVLSSQDKNQSQYRAIGLSSDDKCEITYRATTGVTSYRELDTGAERRNFPAAQGRITLVFTGTRLESGLEVAKFPIELSVAYRLPKEAAIMGPGSVDGIFATGLQMMRIANDPSDATAYMGWSQGLMAGYSLIRV
jgi:hypothetical protein